MITFYEWNKTFRTLNPSHFSPLSKQVQELMSRNDDLLINSYQKQSYKSSKKATLKQRAKLTGKQIIKAEQNSQGAEYEQAPLKNLAIQERLKTLTPCKDGFMVRNSLIISRVNVDKCENSFRKYVSKRAQESLTCSARQDSTINNERKNKPPFNHRYSARRCESMSEAPFYFPKGKNKPRNQIGSYNENDKMKVLANVIDKCKEEAAKSNNQETLLSRFLKIQKKTEQEAITYQSLNRKKLSKAENTQEQQVYLSPSRRKSYHNSEQTNKRSKYRRSTSNYKATCNNESPKIHKQFFRSISYSWQQQGELDNI